MVVITFLNPYAFKIGDVVYSEYSTHFHDGGACMPGTRMVITKVIHMSEEEFGESTIEVKVDGVKKLIYYGNGHLKRCDSIRYPT